jgi:hypothetical protein
VLEVHVVTGQQHVDRLLEAKHRLGALLDLELHVPDRRRRERQLLERRRAERRICEHPGQPLRRLRTRDRAELGDGKPE